jgi:ABC-type Fe3+ transport system substrate-binding protein
MRHAGIIVGLGVLCLVLFLGGISYSLDIPAILDAKDSAERTRVQALIDGARKENTLDGTGTMVEVKHAERLIAGFKEYYGLPQLKLNYIYGNNIEIIGRVQQALKAGRTPPDVVWLVAWDWYTDLIKAGDLMRYDSPYYKEYTLSHKAGLSMPGYWVSDSYTATPMWNVKELEKRGIKNFNPSSWWDFADPKLGPLTCLSNLVTSVSGTQWAIGMRKALGDEWFIRLAKGKPALTSQGQQGEMWVGSGEYPISLTMRPKNFQRLEEAGVEVRWLWPKEGQVLFPFALTIFANAPHPNTAKLFIDYMRSAPGVDRLASSGVDIMYGRPGVRIPEKEKKYWPTGEIKVIPVDWNKEITVESIKSFREWARKIGLGY